MAEVCGALTALRALDVSYCWCTLPLHPLSGCCETAALAAFVQGCCENSQHFLVLPAFIYASALLCVFYFYCKTKDERAFGLHPTPWRPGKAARATRRTQCWGLVSRELGLGIGGQGLNPNPFADQRRALARSKLSDAALAAMAALTRLTELSLSGLSNRKVSDAAIGGALHRMPFLETVNLWYCRQAR